MSTHIADKKLQAKLRGMIEAEGGLKKVSDRLAVSRTALARYLADLYVRTGTFRGIEASLARAEFRGVLPRNPSTPTELQLKLRAMIEEVGLSKVCRQLDLGSELLARYLADLTLYESSFRGIEVSVAAAQLDGPPPRKTKGGRGHALSG